MRKINLIGIELIILIFLIITPLVSSLDAGSFNQTTQNMCGDGICEPGETASTCPQDCTNPKPIPSSPTTNPPANNTPPATQPSGIQNNTVATNLPVNQPSAGNTTSTNQPASTGNLPAQNSFASIIFPIIVGLIILIILGIIVYLIIRNRNKTNSTSAVFTP